MPAFVSIRNGPFRGVSRPRVRRWAERMLGCLGLSEVELSVALTDDREIRELNRVFRHRDRATDVLSFAMREGEPVGAPTAPWAEPCTEILGDVVIAVETARRQASKRRRPLDEEMCMLLAHGLLHLIGYDHASKREEAVMIAETERLCRAADARAPKSRAAVGNSGSKNRTSARAASRKAAR